MCVGLLALALWDCIADAPFSFALRRDTVVQNFGIIGNGRVHVLELTPTGVAEGIAFDTSDGLYDVVWSEANENVLATASGDGSVKVWDVSAPAATNPVRALHEHTHEVYALAWNTVRKDAFLSASWDDTIKLWSLEGPPASLRTFAEHAYCVYDASWNPRHADLFASASGDHTVRVWDLREPASTLAIPAHTQEVLCLDWSKYDDCILATGAVDSTIKLWDIRRPGAPLTTLMGHGYAVRRVQCSPFKPGVIASCSYDMSVRLWDWQRAAQGGGDPCIARHDHHTEFAVGIDLSCLVEGLMASCGWDEMVYVWQMGTDPRAGVGPPVR